MLYELRCLIITIKKNIYTDSVFQCTEVLHIFLRVYTDAGKYLLDQAHTECWRRGLVGGSGGGCIILYALPLARKGIFLYLASGRLLLLMLKLKLRLVLPILCVCCCLSSCANGSSISRFIPDPQAANVLFMCGQLRRWRQSFT